MFETARAPNPETNPAVLAAWNEYQVKTNLWRQRPNDFAAASAMVRSWKAFHDAFVGSMQ